MTSRNRHLPGAHHPAVQRRHDRARAEFELEDKVINGIALRTYKRRP